MGTHCAEVGAHIECRKATMRDVSVLARFIERSVRELQSCDYSFDHIEAALKTVYGVDSLLIEDGTYLVSETLSGRRKIVGCGGWSKRRTLYGADHWSQRDDELLMRRA